MFLEDPLLVSSLQLQGMGDGYDLLKIVKGAWCEVLIPAATTGEQGRERDGERGEESGGGVVVSGRVIGRETEEGLVWGGENWINSPSLTLYRIVWPKMGADSFKALCERREPSLLEQLADDKSKLSEMERHMRSVVSGETLPGMYHKSSSTFGLYYVEDNEVVGFHRDDVDWTGVYHVTVSAKDLEAPRSPLLLPKTGQKHCRLLEHMNRAAQCFFVVNRDWLLEWDHVPAAQQHEAWQLLLGTLNVGFDTSPSAVPWLTLHATLGTPTAEGIHPNVLNHWLSLTSLMEHLGCPEPQTYAQPAHCHVTEKTFSKSLEETEYSSNNATQSSQQQQEDLAGDKDPKSELRFACGVPEAAEPNGKFAVGWRFPVASGTLESCPKYYWVSNDDSRTVYFKMSEFVHTDRNPVKNVVQDGPGWERRDWEQNEKIRRNFIGPVEQRSRGVQVAYWDDPSSQTLA